MTRAEKTQIEMEAERKKMWYEIIKGLHVFGSLLFIPFFVIVGVAYGLREGITVGVNKAMDLFTEFGKES